MISIPYSFNPRPYQLEVFQALDGVEGKPKTRKKRAFLRWHRRAGKDLTCLCYMFKEAVLVPGNYFYIFPEVKQARQAIWETVGSDNIKNIDRLPIAVDGVNLGIIKRRVNQEMLIELENGSTIRFIGLDHNPDSIRGVSCKGAVFSEFAYQDPDAYKTIMPALRESNGWAIFNSTPQGRNHMYKMDVAVKNSPNWFYSTLQTLWPDEPNYSGLVKESELPEIQDEEGLSQEDMEREYGVSYSAGMKGAYYADQVEKARADERIGTFLYNDHIWVDTYWDLGIKDDTAIWFKQSTGNANIFIDYLEDSGKDPAFYVARLKEKGYRFRTHYLPHDAGHRKIGQLTTADILRDCLDSAGLSSDVVVLDRIPKIIDGINATRSRFASYCFNEGTCADGIEKVSLYHRRYDKKRQAFMKEPVHDWCSHAADALRMEAEAAEFYEDPFNKMNDIKVITEFSVFD